MAYKLLYIEDLDPASIAADLKYNGFEITHINPGTFEAVINEINSLEFQGILLDFRLTQGERKAMFDAPTIAQTLRTKSANANKHFPIFLVSTEKTISSFYEDFTSTDLFDLSIPKELFQKNLSKYCSRIKEFIDSYAYINKVNFNLPQILAIKNETYEKLDYRFSEKIEENHLKTNTYKISRLIHNTVIRSIGLLIGEDVLSARLGVDKSSSGWQALRNSFDSAKYAGIFSGTYLRWWPNEIERIISEEMKIKNYRSLDAMKRIENLTMLGFAELKPIEKLQFATSTNYWTICKDLNYPIDPVDGLGLRPNDFIPWQDKEYISILAAMKTSDLLKLVKPTELERFQEFVKTLK